MQTTMFVHSRDGSDLTFLVSCWFSGRGWCSGRMNMLRGIIGGALRRRARWMLPTQTVHNMGESISDRPKHDHDRPTTAGSISISISLPLFLEVVAHHQVVGR